MFGNLQSEKTGADLQQKLDNQSTQYGKTRVHRNESNLNDLDPDIVIQYTLDDCYKTCDERHPKDNWWDNSLRKTCKFFCRQSNESYMSKCGPVAALDDECWKKCKNKQYAILSTYNGRNGHLRFNVCLTKKCEASLFFPKIFNKVNEVIMLI